MIYKGFQNTFSLRSFIDKRWQLSFIALAVWP